jgi:hypothetical protein
VALLLASPVLAWALLLGLVLRPATLKLGRAPWLYRQRTLSSVSISMLGPLLSRKLGHTWNCWAAAGRAAKATPKAREGARRGFPPLCPDLVVELASPSDAGPRGLTALRRKMAAYQANGARAGWLLIPEQRGVEIWGPLGELAEAPQRLAPTSQLDGSPLFPGLLIDLAEIWAA